MQKSILHVVQRIKKVIVLKKSFPLLLIVLGTVGLLASAAINIEKTHLLKNPNSELSCNLNPVYSCGSVIMTKQAAVFGFSNEIMGLAMFAAIITVGVALLAGATFKAWFWRIFIAGMIGSMVFVAWFFYQSVYVIGALCIFCSLVWFATWSITIAVAAWAYDNKKLPTLSGNGARVAAWKRSHIGWVWAAGIALAAGLILHHFWYYYGQYFGY